MPIDLYTTPVIVTDSINSQDRTLLYAERNIIDVGGETEGYYFVHYDAGSDPTVLPTCEIRTEEDFSISGVTLRSPTDDSKFDGSSSSPTVVIGDQPIVYFSTLQGYVNRYEIGSDAWPDTSSTALHYSEPVTDADADAGPDTSAFVDPAQNLMLFGTKCSTGSNCNTDLAASTPREWGRLYLADLSSTTSPGVLDTFDLEAWTFAAPVGLKQSAGPSGEDILVALGTYESTNSTGNGYEFNGDYDCSMLLVSLTNALSSSYRIEVVDSFDDGIDCVPPDDGGGGFYIEAVDGWSGEPVPHSSNKLLGLRYFGKLYNLQWNAQSMTLQKKWAVVLSTPSGHEFRQPPEHSPIMAIYPDDPKAVALWGANQYLLLDNNPADGVIDGDTYVRSVILEVDLLALSAATGTYCDASLNCDFDVTSPPAYAKLVGEIPSNGSDTPVVWGPGAAGIYYNKDDIDDQYLVYILATGANTEVSSKSSIGTGGCGTTCAECTGADEPPRLHFYYKKSTDTTWSHDQVDLAEDPDNPLCYEVDPVGGTTYRPIRAPGGVTIRGNAAYVATSDGLFWMYSTITGATDQGEENPSPNQYLLAGPADGWPRYRKDNFGTARNY